MLSVIFAQAASRVSLSGYSIQENTTVSSSFACAALRKSVTFPSLAQISGCRLTSKLT